MSHDPDGSAARGGQQWLLVFEQEAPDVQIYRMERTAPGESHRETEGGLTPEEIVDRILEVPRRHRLVFRVYFGHHDHDGPIQGRTPRGVREAFFARTGRSLGDVEDGGDCPACGGSGLVEGADCPECRVRPRGRR